MQRRSFDFSIPFSGYLVIWFSGYLVLWFSPKIIKEQRVHCWQVTTIPSLSLLTSSITYFQVLKNLFGLCSQDRQKHIHNLDVGIIEGNTSTESRNVERMITFVQSKDSK
eukprot:TRINITY_DN2825_c0_g1_i1.p1 TRINITY_DN2825_c0_g1~~TRINITY_DN2825_c0_g1_i1.p1  ORF type:complete len:110 (+),score=8.30 TRINITY_DN2825_c0_g1_i1:291-620(+)